MNQEDQELTPSRVSDDGRVKSKPNRELITGAAADAISAERKAFPRKPTHEQQVREVLGLPPEWRAVIMQREGDHPDYWGVTLEGGICPPKASGKYKGSPNWSKATVKRKYTLTDKQHAVWLRQWEAEEHRCHGCEGTGYAWAGWHFERGIEYRPCRRCNATGVPLPVPPPDPPAASDKSREANK